MIWRDFTPLCSDVSADEVSDTKHSFFIRLEER